MKTFKQLDAEKLLASAKRYAPIAFNVQLLAMEGRHGVVGIIFEPRDPDTETRCFLLDVVGASALLRQLSGAIESAYLNLDFARRPPDGKA